MTSDKTAFVTITLTILAIAVVAGLLFGYPHYRVYKNELRGKGIGALVGALELFDLSVKFAEWSGAPYLIENPVSTVSTYWRKPDHIFDPCDYGDPYTKRTCLWTGGGFVMPQKNRVDPIEGSKIHLIPPGPDRANLRSQTPKGFANAVFHANHKTAG